MNFLKANKVGYYLSNNDTEVIKQNLISGVDFLKLRVDEFQG